MQGAPRQHNALTPLCQHREASSATQWSFLERDGDVQSPERQGRSSLTSGLMVNSTRSAPKQCDWSAVVPTGKQKAAAGRTRQPLGDIGNLVHAPHVLDGKTKLPVPEGINRRVTRSFGSQLLKNNCAVTNKNATAPAPAPPAALKPAVARKVLKPAPRPEQAAAKAINTGSDENRKPSEGATAGLVLPRKKLVDTLSLVLSHRSKEACGLNRKPKDVVEDIDRLDGDNELAVVDYIDDIYSYYKTAQHENLPVQYIDSQPEINPKMRAILVDWLAEVAHKFELMPESFYLTIYIVDRFLSMKAVPRRELQLVGVAAMLIACKYEEMWAPEVTDFIHISDNSYSRQQILGMEKNILNKMSWNLTVPTMYVFLVRFAKAAGTGSDKELEHMVFFFAELALMEYGMVSLCPSLVAASAVYAARCTLNKSPIWTETLKHHTGFNELQLMEHAKALVASHAAAPQSKLKAVYKKYSGSQFARVALHPPAVAYSS
ncbi:cyclin-B1-5-like [Lolium rigidum]|uniref:cyclin-B1-5-like n=1 Tax=Lolium rigidum TaxID=89674 RepID=UPI001F5C416E|nr:cyclin-B1-5-like [Lolium rigidum]